MDRRPHWDDVTKPLDPEFCRQITQSDRWASKVEQGDGGCLVWMGARNRGGYGSLTANGKGWAAHRIAYVAARGEDIPPGMPLDHLCRNRACVNPDHLEVVTGRTNTLRGMNPCAENARKTHCPNGHALDDENLVSGVAKSGRRYCRKCHRIDGRRQSALISAAKAHLGLSWKQYVASYGQSSGAAKAVASGLDCASHDPISGAVCQKPEGHMGAHGGMTKEGSWRNW